MRLVIRSRYGFPSFFRYTHTHAHVVAVICRYITFIRDDFFLCENLLKETRSFTFFV